MSKYCPIIDGPVVYLTCMECDDRICIEKGVGQLAKIIKKPKEDIKISLDDQLEKAKEIIYSEKKKLPMDAKYPGIITTSKIKMPSFELMSFIPVHDHTDYSTKDSVMSIDEYVDRCVELNFPGATITEHGNMSSALKFYKACNAANIKPILGNEIYTDDNIDQKIEASLNRQNRKKDDESIDSGYLNDDDYGHLVLLSPNKEAYHEILMTTAKGFRDGFYKRPRVTHNYILNEASKHQIATTACLASKFNYLIRSGDDKAAKALLSDYRDAFGDRFYVELHFNELNIQRYCTQKILQFAKELKIPWIIGLDAHYARKEHAQYHDYLKAIHYGGTKNEPSKFRYNTRELYVKDSNEIIHSALKWGYDISTKDIQKGLATTMEIYDRTDFKMEMGVLKFPKFSQDPNFDANEELKKKCMKGFYRRKRQGLMPAEGFTEEDYRNRFIKEFPVIVKKGFADYFLVVSNLTDYCLETHLFRGPGRGSAAGSIISWFLGITEIDPIRFGLFFERFLNEDRADPPDIDLDFDSERRFEIEEQLLETYGKEKVAHVMSFGTFAAKGLMRDLSKIFELPWILIDKLCKLFNDDEDIQQNLDRIMGVSFIMKKDKEFRETPPIDIKEFIENNQEFIDAAKFLEGKVRHLSLHAAGVVVTPDVQERFVPINRVSGQIVTGFQEGGDIREISDIGLLKIDALGLNNCSIVNRALISIKERKGKEIDIWTIDLEDQNLLGRFRQGHTSGIFQFESTGITKFIKDMQVQRFEDLIIINAAYRPGTLKAGGVDIILDNRYKTDIDYMHPLIQNVLGPTYNVLVYQEQQMALMNQVGGFTMVEADKSRKTIKLINKASTASPEKLKLFYDMIDKFKEGAHNKTGLSYEQLQKLVDSMASAADYSFNKSHSCSYAVVAMQNMYLKHYYPADYAAAFLSRTKNEEKKGKKGKKTGENKIEKYVKMAILEMGLTVERPDISRSGHDWIPKDDYSIIPSLTFIKGVGDAAVPEIVKHQPYNSLLDFFESDITWRLVNKRVVEALIKTGAFDELYGNRKILLEAYTSWNEKAKNNFMKHLKTAEDKSDGIDFTFDEKMEIERELYGFYFSANPLDKYKEVIEKRGIKEVSQLASGKSWKKGILYGILTKVFPYSISTGTMAFIDIQGKDETKASITSWPELYKEYKNVLVEGNIVAIKVKPGKTKDGSPCFYIDESADGKKVILMNDLIKNS